MLKLTKASSLLTQCIFIVVVEKRPVGCVVGLHSGMVLPFTILLVQPV